MIVILTLSVIELMNRNSVHDKKFINLSCHESWHPGDILKTE